MLKIETLAMNRSFIAPERGMQGGVLKQREQMRASVMKEKEDELALFLEMRRREKERNSLLVQNVDEFDAPLGMIGCIFRCFVFEFVVKFRFLLIGIV